MNKWQKFWGHLRTVQKHRTMVRKLCFKCGLYWQGLTHDLSKYSPIEFWRGVKYFTGTASPHTGERAEYGYSEAWLNHHNRNKHHAEYWVDIVEGKSAPIKMPLKYLIEMVCDRVAASMIYLGDKYTDSAPWDYYISHFCENELNGGTRAELEGYLIYIRENGLKMFLEEIKIAIEEEKAYEKFIRS